MSNYGIRVSYDDFDVKTCNDIDCVITSKYQNLKGTFAETYSGSINSGFITTLSGNHGLPYTPIVKVLLDVYNDGTYAVMPWQEYNAIDDFIRIGVRSDDTKIKIRIDYESPTGASRIINLKYFIFIDKAKL